MQRISINSLNVTNYRNYSHSKCVFGPNFNVITGLNGAGKTSLIDAVYYLCNGKSYFSYKDEFLYNHGTGFFNLKGNLSNDEQVYEVHINSSSETPKKIMVDEKKAKNLAEHIGRFPAFMIAPKDIQIIMESASERRRLMDKTLSQVDRVYLKSLLLYNRLLKQRNAALKAFREQGRVDNLLFDSLSQKMEEPAHYIFTKRQKYVEAITPIVNDLYNELSQKREKVSISYESPLLEKSWSEIVEEKRHIDLAICKSSSGIHKDDMKIMLDDKPIKKYASQGQLKSSIIAIKLAQLVWVRNDVDKIPILLLDDIFDKLDEERVQQFLHICDSTIGAQVLITDTDSSRIENKLSTLGLEFKSFKITEGTIASE